MHSNSMNATGHQKKTHPSASIMPDFSMRGPGKRPMHWQFDLKLLCIIEEGFECRQADDSQHEYFSALKKSTFKKQV